MKTTVKKSLATVMAILLLLSTWGSFVFNASAEGEFTSGYYTHKEDTYVLPKL